MKQKMKSLLKALAVVLCVIAIFFIGLFNTHNIGIPGAKIQDDIRKNSHIEDSWEVTGQVSDTFAGYISYPEDQSDYSFSVYVNRPGLSFGYFFRGGGSLTAVERKIAKFVVEDYTECAYISMNQSGASLLEIDDGGSVQQINIDPMKPFAMVLPINAGIVTFTDADGNVIEVFEEKL